MWTLLKIGTFYAAPVVAVAAALVLFVVLLRRVRRGAQPRKSAALVYACTILFPLVAVGAIWGVAELSSFAAAGAEQFAWDREASLAVLASLLPIAAYVAAPIALSIIAFWIVLARQSVAGRP